eukprot:RCo014994
MCCKPRSSSHALSPFFSVSQWHLCVLAFFPSRSTCAIASPLTSFFFVCLFLSGVLHGHLSGGMPAFGGIPQGALAELAHAYYSPARNPFQIVELFSLYLGWAGFCCSSSLRTVAHLVASEGR